MRSMMLLGASLLLLTGCATSGPAIDACGPWRAIYVGKADVLTEDTARSLLAHNRTGRELCGWGARQ
jgi:hypothetical protein